MAHSSRPPRKPPTESFQLGVADTGPMSAAAIRGESDGNEVSAWEAAKSQRARQETEPLRKEKRRLATGTGYLSVPRRAEQANVSRADTVEDFRVTKQAEDG